VASSGSSQTVKPTASGSNANVNVSGSGSGGEAEGVEGKIAGDDKMKIAWRYQNLPKVDGSQKAGVATAAVTAAASNVNVGLMANYCRNFDLTKGMSQDSVQKCDVHLLDLSATSTSHSDEGTDDFQRTFQFIKKMVDATYRWGERLENVEV
jgi:hypothetical protein